MTNINIMLKWVSGQNGVKIMMLKWRSEQLKFVCALFFMSLLVVSCGSEESGKEQDTVQDMKPDSVRSGGTNDEAAVELAHSSPSPEESVVPPPEESSVEYTLEESIQQTVDINMKEILHECERYAHNPEVIFSLDWIIDSNGHPKNVTVSEHKVGDIAFINCATKKIETIQFYNVPKDYHVTVHFTFNYPNKSIVYA